MNSQFCEIKTRLSNCFGTFFVETLSLFGPLGWRHLCQLHDVVQTKAVIPNQEVPLPGGTWRESKVAQLI